MKKFKKVDSLDIPGIDAVLSATPDSSKRFISKSLDIADQISFILSEKGMLQKTLAAELKKEEPEISKWLSGSHNFTIRTITLIESVLKEEIIMTPFKLRAGLSLRSIISTPSKTIASDIINSGKKYKITAQSEENPKESTKVRMLLQVA